MMKLATAEQMRALDQRAARERGVSTLSLMERAAEQICRGALELLPDRPAKCRAAVLCGSGSNGGDGAAAARLLFLAGVRVRAFLAGSYEKLTGDALAQAGRLSECGVELERLDPADQGQRAWVLGADVCVDALFGVGLSREITPDSLYADAVDWMNAPRGRVVSADLPSGVEADTGRVLGRAVKADKTITFTLPKPGLFVGAGAALAGEVEVRDIGVPPALVRETVCEAQTIETSFVREALPARKREGHKGDFGKVLVVGGSVGLTGAPYLTALGAARSGCGLVYLGVPEGIWAAEAAKCVSAMPFPLPEKKGMFSEKALQEIEEKLEGCDVLALGPGLGRGEGAVRLAHQLLRRTEKPVVLDADGINALSAHIDVLDARRGRITVLTPHDGEFARIGGDLTTGNRLGEARRFARQHGCVLVLKGWRTIVAGPAGNALVNVTGCSGLAKGGSGDVLTGVIASLLAQGATPVQAAGAGVWLHGRAGELAAARLTEYAMGPEDAAAALAAAFCSLAQEQE